MSFDAGRHDASAASYAEAITAAGAADDELVAAHAYANLSMLALAAAQPRRAVQYAQAGQRAAVRRAGPRLRALLLAREAQGYGRLGDRGATNEALQRAERAFNTSRGADPGWTAFFTDAELAGAAGSSLRMLGDADAAVRHLQNATRINGRARNRASWVLQLAEGLAAAGDPAQACTVATDALPLVSDLASTRVRHQVRRVAAAVSRDTALPEVREFQDRLMALGLAS